MTSKHDQLWESLADPQFRSQFIDDHINVGVAFQIRSLRERQNLTQAQVADLLGDKKKQPMISAWENPNYGKYTLATLRELAKAFDVGLLVRFVSFGELVNWTVGLTGDHVAPASFEEEQRHALYARSKPVLGTAAAASAVDGLIPRPSEPAQRGEVYATA